MVEEEITGRIRKYFELNDNFKNLGAAAKAVFTRKLTLKSYIRKERFGISNVS